MRWWQLTEHDSYLRGIIILWPLLWDEDNLWGMIYIFGMHNHAWSVIMRRRQLAGHVFIDIWYITMLWSLSWDDDSWRSMFHTLEMNNCALVVVMRWWQLTEHDSYFKGYNHTLTVVMWRWQLTEHVSFTNDILPCSDRCHKMNTTGKAFSYHRDIDYINRKNKVLQMHLREHHNFHKEALLWHLSV